MSKAPKVAPAPKSTLVSELAKIRRQKDPLSAQMPKAAPAEPKKK